MGTIKHHFDADVFNYRTATPFPQYFAVDGTTGPVTGLKFSATTEEAVFIRFRVVNYGSGNWTALIGWYADTATSGGVTWGIQVAAITPNTDTQDVEAKAFSTEMLIPDTHLGTTGQRAHDVIGALSALDSVASDDWVTLKFLRKISDANDTMTGDAVLTMLDISYSDT